MRPMLHAFPIGSDEHSVARFLLAEEFHDAVSRVLCAKQYEGGFRLIPCD